MKRSTLELETEKFGEELQDIKGTDQFLSNSVHFMHEVKEFMKERSEIEKEYSKKLENLAKKYTKTAFKRTSNVNSGSIVKNYIDKDIFDSFGENTLENTWNAILTQLEKSAVHHSSFSESLLSDIAEKLKCLAAKKENSRKKQILFIQKLVQERDKIYHEQEEKKKAYDEACYNVEQAKLKYDRSMDEKQQDKAKKQFHLEIMEMNNQKNLYLISVKISNLIKEKYYKKDLDYFLNQQKLLNKSKIDNFQNILMDYINLERSKIETYLKIDIGLSESFTKKINGNSDMELFLIKNGCFSNKAKFEKLCFENEFSFSPCGFWKDSDQFVEDKFSKNFLLNKLLKLKKLYFEMESENDKNIKIQKGLLKLEEVYLNNPAVGDLDAVQESIRELKNELTLFEYQCNKVESEIDILKSLVEENENDANHVFIKSSFAIPTTCEYCSYSIWGVRKLGYFCKTCNIRVHEKCEAKVSPICLGNNNKFKHQKKKDSISKSHLSTIQKQSINCVNDLQKKKDSTLTVFENEILNKNEENCNQNRTGELKARILYDYRAAQKMGDVSVNEFSELTVMEGEIVDILSPDSGSGWTLVKSHINNSQGMIPTSYMAMVDGDLEKGNAGRHCFTEASVSTCTRDDNSLNLEFLIDEKKKTTALEDEKWIAAFDYVKAGAGEVSLKEGDIIKVLDDIEVAMCSGWINILTPQGEKGIVPLSYLDKIDS
ncbi:hypothetical protein HK099_004313 [Clydaea vesicula]|uniref:Uncharacterized protein n=1 Tax=Clydaea vesicula TaxID=447962 RepID=A0AAD5UBJ0_9FUNG|nr:hypothetical protein HK099_004313 [Clydaea vesicula]KAJ3383064.1 hypothetical protein HDU92_004407 [Lobulomyces angularis]